MADRSNAVVFDLDGVLIDSEPLWVEAIGRHLAEQERSGWGVQQYRALVGMRGDEWAAAICARYGLAESPAALRAAVERSLLESAPRLRPPAAARKAVAALAAEYRLAVASSSSEPFIVAALAAIGISDAFEAIASADDVAKSKPAPDVYVHALTLLGVDSTSAVAIEDSEAGIAAALAAGLRVVALGSHPAGDGVTPIVSLSELTTDLVAGLLRR